MLPEKDEDSANVLALTITLSGIVSAIFGVACIFFGTTIAAMLNEPSIAGYLIYAPIVIFLSSSSVAIQYWLSRKVRFGATATSRVATSITTRGSQVAVGVVQASPAGLIFGVSLGYIVGNIFMLKGICQDLHLVKAISFEKMRQMGYRYRDFPKFTLFGQIVNEASSQMTSFLLIFYFSSAIVGYYALGHQIVALPTGLVGAAAAQVFFQKASEERTKKGSVKVIADAIHSRLVSFGMFPTILLMILAEDIFGFFWGAQLFTAGTYVMLFAPWELLVLISMPLITLCNVLEKQKVGLLFNFALFVSRVAVLTIGGLSGDAFIAILLYSVTGVLFWGWLNFYLLNLAGVSYKDSFAVTWRHLLLGVVIAAPVLAEKLLGLPSLVLFATAAVASCVYYGIVIMRDAVMKDLLRGCMIQIGILR